MWMRSVSLAAAVSVGIGLAQSAGAATPVRVGTSSAQAFNFMPLPLGIELGYFQKSGLDVQVIALAGSAKLHQAMTAGAIDLGLGAGTDIAFLVKGAPELAVGAIALTPAQFGITVPYDSPVHSLAQLKGKRFGISTVGSLTQWIALQLAKKEGWTASDIRFVEDGSTPPPQVAALLTGAIDAQVSGAALGWNLEEQKKGRMLAPASDFVGPFLMNVIFASKAIIAHDPGAVRAFLKGWYEAVDFMAQNRGKTIAMARAIDHYSQAVEEKQYAAVMPSLSRDGRFPPAAVATVQHSFLELHILPTAPDMANYLTTAFLPKTS